MDGLLNTVREDIVSELSFIDKVDDHLKAEFVAIGHYWMEVNSQKLHGKVKGQIT